MKIGLGLYREQLTPDNFRFAVQADATHVVAHLTNHFAGRDPKIHGGDSRQGWGDCSTDTPWTCEELSALVAALNAEGLELAALEYFSPRFRYDVLLGGPERPAQIVGLKHLIRDAGRAGVPCSGYNFSIAGVYGRTRGPDARSRANSVGLGMAPSDPDAPIPDGMRYRAKRPAAPPVSPTESELWDRLRHVLSAVVPVAREVGATLAAHPDDPPLDFLRNSPRLVNRPEKSDRLMSLVDSPRNAHALGPARVALAAK